MDEIDGAKVYDQKQTLTIADKTSLKIDLTIYAIEKIRIWESIDNNRDKKLTSEEKKSWMTLGSASSYLTDYQGQKINFIPVNLDFPDYYQYFDRPPAKITIEFSADSNLNSGETYRYTYKGKDKSLIEINFELIGAENLTRTDNSSVSFTALESSIGKSVLGIEASDRLNSFLSSYVKRDEISPGIIISALIASLILGAIHALTPGHGKAIIAGYLIGSKGTVIHAVELALIITVTHSASVFILGILAIILTGYFVPSTVVLFLNKVSGILIVGFGIYLLFYRIRELQHHRKDPRHHLHKQDIAISWKSLISLGISGGIVPCVDALAILIVAATLGKLILGMLILISFSIGLAVALTAAGLVAVFAKNEVSRRWNVFEKYQHLLGIFSAAVVTILGLALLK